MTADLFLGADVGGTGLKFVVVSAGGLIIIRGEVPTAPDDVGATLERLREAVSEDLAENSTENQVAGSTEGVGSLGHLAAVGLACAGIVDLESGSLGRSPNLPGWEGGLEGLYACLGSSFQISPPTAIIASSIPNYFATQSFLLNRGIRVPQDLSMVCIDDDPNFNNCRPTVSHTHWSRRAVANRIVRWVGNIALGKEDTRQTSIKAGFIEGGTTGPVGGKLRNHEAMKP